MSSSLDLLTTDSLHCIQALAPPQAYANSKLCTLLAAKHLDRIFMRWVLQGDGQMCKGRNTRAGVAFCLAGAAASTFAPVLQGNLAFTCLSAVPAVLQGCGAASRQTCQQWTGDGGGRAAGARRICGCAPGPGGHIPCTELLQGRLGGFAAGRPPHAFRTLPQACVNVAPPFTARYLGPEGPAWLVMPLAACRAPHPACCAR